MNASCILASISDQAKQYFKGPQYGMEFMGTEKNIHAINYLRDNVPAWDHVSLDQENTFNLAKRKAAMVTAIKDDFPALFDCFRTYYFNANSLLFSDREKLSVYEFFSCEGVQQGDPLAPNLFCVASLPYVRELQTLAQSGIATALFDDTNIVADTDNCVAATKYAQEKGPGFGLHPQAAKFKLRITSKTYDSNRAR